MTGRRRLQSLDERAGSLNHLFSLGTLPMLWVVPATRSFTRVYVGSPAQGPPCPLQQMLLMPYPQPSHSSSHFMPEARWRGQATMAPPAGSLGG